MIFCSSSKINAFMCVVIIVLKVMSWTTTEIPNSTDQLRSLRAMIPTYSSSSFLPSIPLAGSIMVTKIDKKHKILNTPIIRVLNDQIWVLMRSKCVLPCKYLFLDLHQHRWNFHEAWSKDPVLLCVVLLHMYPEELLANPLSSKSPDSVLLYLKLNIFSHTLKCKQSIWNYPVIVSQAVENK